MLDVLIVKNLNAFPENVETLPKNVRHNWCLIKLTEWMFQDVLHFLANKSASW